MSAHFTDPPSRMPGRAGSDTSKGSHGNGADSEGQSSRHRAAVVAASEGFRCVEVVGPADWPDDTAARLLHSRQMRMLRERDLMAAFSRRPDDPGCDETSTMDADRGAYALYGALACLVSAIAVIAALVWVLVPMVSR